MVLLTVLKLQVLKLQVLKLQVLKVQVLKLTAAQRLSPRAQTTRSSLPVLEEKAVVYRGSKLFRVSCLAVCLAGNLSLSGLLPNGLSPNVVGRFTAGLGAVGLGAIGLDATGFAVGLTLPFYAAASAPLKTVGPETKTLNGRSGTSSKTAASAERVDDQRLVKFFFSEGAWGGAPFNETQKQQVMLDALLGGKLARTEAEVTHLLSAPEARVRRFVAVFEVDGRVQPPAIRSGYELELLVPHSRKPLDVELENAETGVVNRVEVEPEGSL